MNASTRDQVSAAGVSADTDSHGAGIPSWLRIAAIFLRSAFICALAVLTLRVSMPQAGTLWQIYDTPGDAVRLLLAICACIWLAIQLFRLPKDAGGYRTWLVLGIFAVPFVVICLVAVW